MYSKQNKNIQNIFNKTETTISVEVVRNFAQL